MNTGDLYVGHVLDPQPAAGGEGGGVEQVRIQQVGRIPGLAKSLPDLGFGHAGVEDLLPQLRLELRALLQQRQGLLGRHPLRETGDSLGSEGRNSE